MRTHPLNRITELFEFDFASQIIDIISLRPEVGLRYFGIGLHCFEILEAPATTPLTGGGGGGGAGAILSAWDSDVWASVEDSLSSFESDDDEDSEEEDEFGDGGIGQHALFVDAVSSGEDGDEDDEGVNSDDDEGGSNEEEVDSNHEDEDEDEEAEEDDGFVDPGSESVRFELRKVEFSSVQVDIFQVMFGKL
jgi:hypothetical protein